MASAQHPPKTCRIPAAPERGSWVRTWDNKTGFPVIETTLVGAPAAFQGGRGTPGAQLCSLIARRPSWLARPAQQDRSHARLSSNLAASAPRCHGKTTSCPPEMLPRPRGGSPRVSLAQPSPVVPVSLALIQHLHLPEDPAADVPQAFLYDLKGKKGDAQGAAPLLGLAPTEPGNPPTALNEPVLGPAEAGRGCLKGLRQQNRLFPVPGSAAKPLPPRPQPSRGPCDTGPALSHGAGEGPCAPAGAGCAMGWAGGPHTQPHRGKAGCCHRAALPADSVSPLGHPKAPQGDGQSHNPLGSGCVLTQNPSQLHTVPGSLWGAGPWDQHPLTPNAAGPLLQHPQAHRDMAPAPCAPACPEPPDVPRASI